MKTLIPRSDRFLYFLDSKFTIRLLTANSHAGQRKQSKNTNNNNSKQQRPEKTMAIDQAFGERGGIPPIRFISFLAALTFPFAHSNWQNKIPVWLSSLSSTPGNHSSATPYTPPLPHTCSLIMTVYKTSTQRLPFRQEFKEQACRWASLQSEVTCTNHLREGHISAFHFLPITTSCLSLSLCASLAPPAYLNNSSKVQPSPGITISISLPGHWLAARAQGVSQPSISFRHNFLTPPHEGSNGLFPKQTQNRGKLYKLNGRMEGSVAEPRQLREPRRPRVSLIMSLPSQTETHWMIMLQIEHKSLSLFLSKPLHLHPSLPTIYHVDALPFPPPFRPPAPPPFHLSPLHSASILLLTLSVAMHLSSYSQTFLGTPPVWSSGNMLSDFGQIWWCSLPPVAFNQLKSYFGDEQRGSCFFHELHYNRITQPEGQVPHHWGLHR